MIAKAVTMKMLMIVAFGNEMIAMGITTNSDNDKVNDTKCDKANMVMIMKAMMLLMKLMLIMIMMLITVIMLSTMPNIILIKQELF